ncbi:MAG: hypothetical protein AB9856_13870 [Cellulosilyticaceae bacterium]
MRLQIVKSKNVTSLYILKLVYTNAKHASKVVEKLVTYDPLLEKLNGEDHIK